MPPASVNGTTGTRVSRFGCPWKRRTVPFMRNGPTEQATRLTMVDTGSPELRFDL